jgi:hypothetical protein
MLAAPRRIAPVIGAGVAVIAIERCTRHALSVYTGLLTRAHIVVGTISVFIALTAGNKGKHASRIGIAGIAGAAVPVITADSRTRRAGTVHTDIGRGAGTAVFTGQAVVCMLAAPRRITPVVGTDVAVIAIERQPSHTVVAGTPFCAGANIAVIAVTVGITLAAGNGGKDASRARITGISRAAVPVITGYQGTLADTA